MGIVPCMARILLYAECFMLMDDYGLGLNKYKGIVWDLVKYQMS